MRRSARRQTVRHVERGACRRAAGEDEPPQWRQLGLEPVDGALEPRDVCVTQLGPGNAIRDLVRRVGQLRR
jgi:hypothetical protein